MKRIWAPWRMQYIRNADKATDCILCSKPLEKDDRKNYILYRGKSNFVMLNAFPYTAGHLMIAPYRHIGNLLDVNAGEGQEQIELLKLCIDILTREVSPAGFNLGMNIGRVAGAGIDGHIHYHIVPRWNGDHNFMPVLADARVISEGLAETYDKLKKSLDQMP